MLIGNNNEQKMWTFFISKGITPAGCAGIIGNAQAESGLIPTNLQNSFEKKSGYTDKSYTEAVDNGTYKNFIYDKAGYGIFQFTYWSLKQGLYNYCKEKQTSIGDLESQLEYFYSLLNKSYKPLFKILKSTTSVQEASDEVLMQFERPATITVATKTKRYNYSLQIYNRNKIEVNSKMKYNASNKPLVCMMTNSTCYKGTKTMKPVGVLWHSTGANNPTLRRYVQPSENDSNYNELIAVLGKNNNKNDWNHKTVQAGLNCWIGKLANGTVATVQTMPWNYRPWGCGSGPKGSCNDGWIQFEIAEDSLTDEAYFNEVYKEACEITAYLCQMYNIDPNGTVKLNGVTVPTILCHNDSGKLKLGSNHADINHWFPKFGKSMATARQDVANLLNSTTTPAVNPEDTEKEEREEEMTQEQFNTMMNAWLAEQATKDPSAWSSASRAWAEKKELIKGDSNSAKAYKRLLTREEMVEVLYRFANNLKEGIG